MIVSEGEDSEPVRGLFGALFVERLSERLGRDVSVDEIAPALNALIVENLVLRRGHGRYGVADPIVREAANARRALGSALEDASRTSRGDD